MSNSEVTQLLHELGRRESAQSDLLSLVYDTLQSIARSRLRGERPQHTLQPTALVHEAFVRLLGDEPVCWQDRHHFFGVASEAMRRVLVDHARRHRSQKRGGARRGVPLSGLDLSAGGDPEQILALDEALEILGREAPRAARVVELRFYAGLNVDETAQVLATSPRTVAREWAYARARLFRLLDGETRGDG